MNSGRRQGVWYSRGTGDGKGEWTREKTMRETGKETCEVTGGRPVEVTEERKLGRAMSSPAYPYASPYPMG